MSVVCTVSDKDVDELVRLHMDKIKAGRLGWPENAALLFFIEEHPTLIPMMAEYTKRALRKKESPNGL